MIIITIIIIINNYKILFTLLFLSINYETSF